MAPATAIRSFAIALAIVIAVIEPQVSGFVIHQNNTREKKVNVPIKNVFGTQNMVKGEKGLGIYKNEKHLKYVTDITTSESEGKTTQMTTDADAVTTDHTLNPTISSDTIEVTDSTEETRENLPLLSDENTSVSNNMELATTKTDVTAGKDNTITTTATFTTETVKYSAETELTSVLPIEKNTYTTARNSEGITTVTLSSIFPSTISTVPFTSSSNSPSTDETITINLPPTSPVSTSSYDPSTTSNSTGSTLSIDNRTQQHSANETRTTTEMDSVIILNDEYTSSQKESTDIITTSSDKNEQVSTGITSPDDALNINDTTVDYTVTTTPTEVAWKKYVTIARRRTTESEESSKTTTEQETITPQYNNSSELIMSTTNTEGLTIGLLPRNKTEEPMSAETARATLSVQSTITSSNTISDENKAFRDDNNKAGSVATKRGGFLNLSEYTTPVTTEQQTSTTEQHIATTGGISNQTDLPENNGPEKGKITEKQRQLEEDAIQEEFLREEVISNLEQNRSEGVRPLGGDRVADEAPAGGDALSVRPIHHERNKSALYAVAANYRPMKKIDVQPARPFLRDPDDNSWRNESISSLGIVFKAKNATKSFKEVLKNKSQTELNNLQERDGKDDVPDLRVRLEKIAEVRKTKRKKTDGNGEVVYADYEEGSAENGTDRTTKQSLLPTLERTPLATPPLALPAATPAPKPEPSDDAPSTPSAENFFSRVRTVGPLAAQRERAFDAAEYYDTTDEYDADYATLAKIDLKKEFRLGGSTDAPIAPTAPMPPAAPPRRPTLQYFPPRSTQRVSLNDVDRDFETKVSMFSDVEPPRVPVTPAAPPPPTLAAPAPPATEAPADAGPPDTPLADDESFRRGSYAIKHYGDFLARAAADDDAEPERSPPTVSPAEEAPAPDYDAQFRREVLSRFIDNFNQNSERFKADFPVLYNSSVVHRRGPGVVASSRAFVKRVYEPAGAGAGPCGGCGAVELSPAYELHYYVPEQEEREDAPRDLPLLPPL